VGWDGQTAQLNTGKRAWLRVAPDVLPRACVHLAALRFEQRVHLRLDRVHGLLQRELAVALPAHRHRHSAGQFVRAGVLRRSEWLQ
jgi:hypothetical protein